MLRYCRVSPRFNYGVWCRIDKFIMMSWLGNTFSLQWRHNRCDSVSNHHPHDCLLNRLFRHRSKRTSKLLATGLFAGNSQVAGEFPAQMASNAENVSIWWRYHVTSLLLCGAICASLVPAQDECAISFQGTAIEKPSPKVDHFFCPQNVNSCVKRDSKYGYH